MFCIYYIFSTCESVFWTYLSGDNKSLDTVSHVWCKAQLLLFQSHCQPYFQILLDILFHQYIFSRHRSALNPVKCFCMKVPWLGEMSKYVRRFCMINSLVSSRMSYRNFQCLTVLVFWRFPLFKLAGCIPEVLTVLLTPITSAAKWVRFYGPRSVLQTFWHIEVCFGSVFINLRQT